ncbi:MAG: hypothetical protein JST66_03200 [Bacteroidetes bacterium]|nr:hypothetical protein [Bacteroidota bacterium]
MVAILARAQNLVPNPSFEEYTECPSYYGEWFKIDNWFTGFATPDYFHMCDGSDFVGVPRNVFGYQQPATGQAYCGIWGYSAAGPGFGLHELLGIRLNEPLIVGETYWASVKVSWTTGHPFKETNAGFASNKLGLFLSLDSLVGEQGWLPWPGGAQVYTEQIITDSVGWTTIAGHFTADAPYVFLYVGNVFGDDQTQVIRIQDGTDDFSYYYVDDVCLSMDSAFCPIDMGIQEAVPMDRPMVAWSGVSMALRVMGAQAGIYDMLLYDVVGRLLDQRAFASSGLQDDVLVPIRTNVLAPVILRLQSGEREWHYKLTPPVP